MDYLLLGRIAKVVALFGFFLPWVTVSCSNTEIMQATGWQLMTGNVEVAGQAQLDRDPEPAPLVILAFVVIAVGLAATFAVSGRAAAMALLIGALAGLVVSYASIQNLRSEMTRQMDRAETEAGEQGGGFFSARQQREMTRDLRSAIRVEEQEGFWLTTLALLAAAALGAIMLADRRSGVRPNASG